MSATETSSLLYPGSHVYSPDRMVAPQVLTATSASLRRPHYGGPPLEEKADGDSNELLEITLPPPAAYNQGYHQSSYQPAVVNQCYQPQDQQQARLKPGYPQQVFQDYHHQHVLPPGRQLPQSAYPPPLVGGVKGVVGGHPGLQYISSAPLNQNYSFPGAKDPLGLATGNKVVTTSVAASPYATLPHNKVTTSSSFATLPPKDTSGANQESSNPVTEKMSTLYNPLSMFPSSTTSSPTYSQKCGVGGGGGGLLGEGERGGGVNTGSLKRGVKPPGQDVLRIRDNNTRNRSASLSSVSSKRESSV